MFDRAALVRLVVGRGLARARLVRMGSSCVGMSRVKGQGTTLRPQRVDITRLRTRKSFVRVF